jgi:hypothetical protein
VAGSRRQQLEAFQLAPRGEPVPTRPAGVTGLTEPDDCKLIFGVQGLVRSKSA